MNQKTQKNIEYVLLLVIVAITVCAYRFGYMSYVEKAEKIDRESKAIEARVSELREKEALKPVYEETIKESDQQFEEIIKKYGVGNTPEKSLVFVTEMEKKTKGNVNTVSFSENVPVFVSSGSEKTATAYSGSLVLNYEMTYKGLKEAMDYINSYPERMNIDSFTTTVNQETGKLTGTMTINLYSIAGEGRDYVEPEIAGIKTGVDNIFGSD